MAVLASLIKADKSLGKAKVKALGRPSIVMGSYAYLRDGVSNVKALGKVEDEIFESGDEALIAEWCTLVEELNRASGEFVRKYMEAKDSPLQKLAKMR